MRYVCVCVYVYACVYTYAHVCVYVHVHVESNRNEQFSLRNDSPPSSIILLLERERKEK